MFLLQVTLLLPLGVTPGKKMTIFKDASLTLAAAVPPTSPSWSSPPPARLFALWSDPPGWNCTAPTFAAWSRWCLPACLCWYPGTANTNRQHWILSLCLKIKLTVQCVVQQHLLTCLKMSSKLGLLLGSSFQHSFIRLRHSVGASSTETRGLQRGGGFFRRSTISDRHTGEQKSSQTDRLKMGGWTDRWAERQVNSRVVTNWFVLALCVVLACGSWSRWCHRACAENMYWTVVRGFLLTCLISPWPPPQFWAASKQLLVNPPLHSKLGPVWMIAVL